MPVQVPWNRLIRFIAEEDGNIYYGEPILPEEQYDVGRSPAGSLRAKNISGNPLHTSCVVTESQMTVRQLLSPLSREVVPAVRCIGGNYKTHREPAPRISCAQILTLKY